MSKAKYSVKLKQKVVNYVLKGHSFRQAAVVFDVCKSSIWKWVKLYEQHGVDGLKIKKYKHNKYDGDFRIHVIEYMHENILSYAETAALFNIPSSSTVSQWDRIYLKDGPDGLYSVQKKRDNPMKENLPKTPETRDNETLAEENRRLRIEVEYLKKLNALVQAREASKKETK